jgi:hypothetical protein
MAYNVDNWGVISSGATIGVDFLINGGQGGGSQWAEGAPQDGGNTLVTSRARIGFGDDRKFVYGFDLTCIGRGTSFGLHGGGQT